MKSYYLFLMLVVLSCADTSTPMHMEEDPITDDLAYSKEKIMDWDGTMYFNDDNPFLSVISPEAQVHPRSADMIEEIKKAVGANLSNTYISVTNYGTPVYFAHKDVERKDVKIDLYNKPAGKSILTEVPIPEGVSAASGTDKHLIVVDHNAQCAYEFWVYKNGKAASGNAISLLSDGIYKDGRSTVAAGWSQLQGLIWPSELRSAKIEHALSFAVPITYADGHVRPATHNDGTINDQATTIPEGTLIRIKPDVDLDALYEAGSIENTVYKAIQKYGMYCGDTNGAGLGIRGVSDVCLPANAYPEEFDFKNQFGNYYLKNFPFDHLEVIYTGEIKENTTVPYINHGCAYWK